MTGAVTTPTIEGAGFNYRQRNSFVLSMPDNVIRHGDTVTVTYTKRAYPPTGNPLTDLFDGPLQDADGNEVASFSNYGLTNNTFKSGNTGLGTLSLSGVTLDPAFDPSVSRAYLGYDATVPHSFTRTTVTASPAHARASLSITPADADPETDGRQLDLSPGLNRVYVTVTAENEAEYTHFVDVTRSLDTTAPSLEKAAIDGDTLTLTYSEALDESSTPDKGAFTVNATDSADSAVSTPGVTTVAVSGMAVTLSLDAAVRHGDTVTLDYTAGTNPIRDLAENGVPDFTGRTVDNDTAKATDAALESLALSNAALSPAFASGRKSYTAFVGNEISQTTVSAAAADSRSKVAVSRQSDTGQASPRSASLQVGVTDITVTVTPEDAAAAAGVYTVRVTRDSDTTAPSLSSATVDGATLTLTYGEALDESSTPDKGAFTVNATDSADSTVSTPSVTGVSVSGETVTLTLDAAVRHGDRVTLGYTAGTDPVQDTAGNDALKALALERGELQPNLRLRHHLVYGQRSPRGVRDHRQRHGCGQPGLGGDHRARRRRRGDGGAPGGPVGGGHRREGEGHRRGRQRHPDLHRDGHQGSGHRRPVAGEGRHRRGHADPDL